MEIISKTIKIKANNMPPNSDFIENEIKKQGLSPIRWAIVDVRENNLTLSVSGYKDIN